MVTPGNAPEQPEVQNSNSGEQTAKPTNQKESGFDEKAYPSRWLNFMDYRRKQISSAESKSPWSEEQFRNLTEFFAIPASGKLFAGTLKDLLDKEGQTTYTSGEVAEVAERAISEKPAQNVVENREETP